MKSKAYTPLEVIRQQEYEIAGGNLYPVRIQRNDIVTVRIENHRLLVINCSTGEIKGELQIELNMKKAA